MVGSPTSKEILRGWERKEYGFGIPCRYLKAIGKYGFTAGRSVPNYPSIRGIAWYACSSCVGFDSRMAMGERTINSTVPYGTLCMFYMYY